MKRCIGLTALMIASSLLLQRAAPFVLINISKSLPRGVYLRKYSSISVGDLVVVCAESISSLRWITDRKYTGPGGCVDGTAPLLKPVAAMGPSHVVTTPKGVTINGKAIKGSTPIDTDSRGNRLPAFRGETFLQDDQLYLLSTQHVLSLDSRYFGPVPKQAVRMIVTPLLTEEVLWRQ